jgi:hypothetical protein
MILEFGTLSFWIDAAIPNSNLLYLVGVIVFRSLVLSSSHKLALGRGIPHTHTHMVGDQSR